MLLHMGRSREGAWIEIKKAISVTTSQVVAPVRERGLKCTKLCLSFFFVRRSREGAWIEILLFCETPSVVLSLP